jgi:hypothetical protein
VATDRLEQALQLDPLLRPQDREDLLEEGGAPAEDGHDQFPALGPWSNWPVRSVSASRRRAASSPASASAGGDRRPRTAGDLPRSRRLAASAHLAEGDTHELHVFDVESGKSLFSAPGSVRAYSPDGRWLAVVNA